MEIFISRNGEKHGPYSLEQIQGFLAAGQAQASDQVWFEGVDGWVPLSQIPGVQLPRMGSVPPPPPQQVAPVAQVTVVSPPKKPPVFLISCGGCLTLLLGMAIIGSLARPKAPEPSAPAASRPSTSSGSSEANAPAPAAMKVSAIELRTAYDSNAIAAEAKYKEKPVAVTGTVDSIVEDIAGDATVMLATDNMFAKVRCVFYDSAKPQIAKLQAGDLVTVSGICADGSARGAVIKNCTAVVKASSTTSSSRSSSQTSPTKRGRTARADEKPPERLSSATLAAESKPVEADEEPSQRIAASRETSTDSSGGSERYLKQNMTGDDVQEWQEFLIEQGHMESPALGNFSKRTREGTIAFQKKWGLYVDGEVGRQTRRRARELGFGSPPVERF
jgi:hypothetical protein